jgi:hypothetical protein
LLLHFPVKNLWPLREKPYRKKIHRKGHIAKGSIDKLILEQVDIPSALCLSLQMSGVRAGN